MLRSSRRSSIPPCARGLLTWGRRFFPASGRRRRHLAPIRRLRSRNGGRSSRRRASRRNEVPPRQYFRGGRKRLICPQVVASHCPAIPAALIRSAHLSMSLRSNFVRYSGLLCSGADTRVPRSCIRSRTDGVSSASDVAWLRRRTASFNHVVGNSQKLTTNRQPQLSRRL